MPTFLRFLLLSSLLFATACSTTNDTVYWPDDLPSQQQFADYYDKSLDNHALQSKSNYLNWVRKFFYGTTLQPKGWSEMSLELEQHVTAEDRPVLRHMMVDLGVKIAKEWAQDNKVRKINTKNMIIWGSVLREAIVADDVMSLVERIDNDVNDLLVGSLAKSDINSDRYFDMEYDEFF